MPKKADLYRMKTDNHVCPYGVKANDLLKKQGYEVEDHLLKSRKETDAFKEKHNVETTPQAFIDGERVGGLDDLEKYFGIYKDKPKTTYKPIIAIFSVTLLMAIATSVLIYAALRPLKILELFIGYSMCVLAIQKLQDLEAFSFQFVTYDLLAMRNVNYSYIYPFAEVFSGIGMIAMVAVYVFAPVSIFIGTIGAISVFKAVYIDRRKLKCACVGGDSNVPLGFVSMTENLMMIGMGTWMLVKSSVVNG
jgi:glutaredoxin